MTFSSSKHKREAGKSTVVKCLHLVLFNKFINTSPYFYFKYKLFKSYRLHQSRILTGEKAKKKNDLEPRIPSSEVSSASSSDTDEPEELERIGNINWCNCDRCFAMETNTESLCCRDTNEVPDVLFICISVCLLL